MLINEKKEPLEPCSPRFPEYLREMSSDKSDTKLETASRRDRKQILEQLLEQEREEDLIRRIVTVLQKAVNKDIQKVSPIQLVQAYLSTI